MHYPLIFKTKVNDFPYSMIPDGDFLAVNANKCLMTRMQEMSLNYHFKVEQESGFTRHAFFGFNGTI